MVGSTREWHNIKTEDFELLHRGRGFTDNTVMTLLVAEWFMKDSPHDKLYSIIFIVDWLEKGNT